MQQQCTKQPLTYSLSWKIKQTRLFICVKTSLAHQVLENVSLFSKPDVLFYSAWNVRPACGVQSVQRTEGKNTTKACLKCSAEYALYERKYDNRCLPLQLG
jgi:hypothetical protein